MRTLHLFSGAGGGLLADLILGLMARIFTVKQGASIGNLEVGESRRAPDVFIAQRNDVILIERTSILALIDLLRRFQVEGQPLA